MSGLRDYRGWLHSLLDLYHDGKVGGGIALESDFALVRRAGLTQAQVNAGHTLVISVDGQKVQPMSYRVTFSGTWTGLTDLRISDKADTPVDVLTITQANATGTHTPGVGTHTDGRGFVTTDSGPLTIGKGVQVRKTGSDATGGGFVLVEFLYSYSN